MIARNSPSSDVGTTFERMSRLDEFRVVTGLLSLATSINNGFSNLTPIAPAPTNDLHGRHRRTTSDELGRSTRRALNAMAILLVQDAEVVACTVPDLSDDPVSVIVIAQQRGRLGLLREAKELEPFVKSTAISDNSAGATLPKESEGPLPTPFTAVSESGREDKYPKGSTSPIKVLTNARGSYWEDICSNCWELLDK